MPFYEFRCDRCTEVFEELLPYSQRDEPRACVSCGHDGVKPILSMPLPPLGGADSQFRKEREDEKLMRVARRARDLKRSGAIPMEEYISPKDPKVQD